VWQELGKVVAVDIFNGNCDRFNIETGKWQNYGNVMFLNAGQTPVIGLDTFEALLILNKPARRKAFAGLCTKSVGTAMKFELKHVQSIKFRVQGPNGP